LENARQPRSDLLFHHDGLGPVVAKAAALVLEVEDLDGVDDVEDGDDLRELPDGRLVVLLRDGLAGLGVQHADLHQALADALAVGEGQRVLDQEVGQANERSYPGNPADQADEHAVDERRGEAFAGGCQFIVVWLHVEKWFWMSE